MSTTFVVPNAVTPKEAFQAMLDRSPVMYVPEKGKPVPGRIVDMTRVYAGKCEFEDLGGQITIVAIERLQKPVLSEN